METYFSYEAGFTDLDNASIIERAETVYLLGQRFSPKEIEIIKGFSTSLIWFTYRKNFPAIGEPLILDLLYILYFICRGNWANNGSGLGMHASMWSNAFGSSIS